MEKIRTVEQKRPWWREEESSKRTCAVHHRPGQLCPHCLEGVLAYDGLFMLTCFACGYIAESGAFT